MLSRAPDGDQRPRLLLVEDDTPVRRSLQLLLQSRGYEVRAYRSPCGLASDPEALRAACLVADHILPEGNGIALLHELRGVGWNGPAVLIAGQLDDGIRRRAAEAGFAFVLAKPLLATMLTGGLARLLSNAPRGSAAAEAGGRD
jgi:FixJ family two-component response regulator